MHIFLILFPYEDVLEITSFQNIETSLVHFNSANVYQGMSHTFLMQDWASFDSHDTGIWK